MKPTKAELMAAARCCMVEEGACATCPMRANGIEDGKVCAADLLVKIAVRIPDDKEAV